MNTTHKNVHIFNQNNGEIPRSGVIDPETINPRDLCYQCSKHGPDYYSVNYGLRILMMNHIFLKE